jgi:hypothetical protein
MDQTTSTILIDLFTNTPFVGFLVWQYVQMRKDVKEQQDRTENLRLEAIEREERMRERFEVVIQGLQEDKDQLVQQLEIRLTQVESKMEVLASQVRKLFAVVTKTKV